MVYKKKADEVSNQRRYHKNMTVVSKTKAMDGDLPDYSFETLFDVKVGKGQREIEYKINWCNNRQVNEGDSSGQNKNYSLDDLIKMPYKCLNNNGRRDEVKSCKVKEGDYLKLGRSFFKVVETNKS